MAANNMRYPIARIAKRSFAAQPAIQPADNCQIGEVNTTVLPNKLMVNAVDYGGPLSRISVAFKVGPRNEVPKNVGIVHLIRSLTGIGTQKCSGFAIVRNMQHNGMHFTCTGDREVTMFNIVGVRTQVYPALKYLAAAASAPAFKHWEVNDNIERLKYQIGELSPQTRVIDMLHNAAYRTGLGNSLFAHKEYIGIHTSSMLETFFKEGFTSNRAVVSGYNVNFKDMLDFAKTLELTECEICPGNSNYFGGEIRKQKNSHFAHVAIAAEGTGLKDIKEALTFSVLRYALGAPPSVIWGGSSSPLYKGIHPVAPDAGACCFSVNYSDSGLFGFIVSSSAENAGKAVQEGVKVLKSGSVSDADVRRAKSAVKADILTACENSENVLEDMAVQSLTGGVLIPGPVLAEAVDKITSGDVSKAAKKIADGKFSLAAIGDLTNVPYLDELQ